MPASLSAPPPCCPHALHLAIALALLSASVRAQAESLHFSERFLVGGGLIDLQPDVLEPGIHRLDVMVNGTWRGTREVSVAAGAACVSSALIRVLTLKTEYRDLLEAGAGTCIDLTDRIEGATVEIDAPTLQLRIGIPQAAQAAVARGAVAPEERDQGISAAFVDYSISQHHARGHDSSFIGLRTGVNLGAWRLRHRATAGWGANGRHYTALGNDLQRDLPGWNSQLLLGQAATAGDLFDSVPFTGLRLFSDERMLPDSQRGYAPVVRGIAHGNAVVRVWQNGALIHEMAVPPGPFTIEDLYPTRVGGDLDVTVTEVDGQQQRFTVNFAAVPQALRAGASRFSVTTGALRDDGGRQALRFAEATYARGLGNRLTALGGAQLAERYGAGVLGLALNTPLGAFGADLTHARGQQTGSTVSSGNSYRLNYQRALARFGTNVGLATYRISTQGFLTLEDAAREPALGPDPVGRPRQRHQINFSQRVGERNTISLGGGQVTYWNTAQRRNDLHFSLQGTVGRANYGVSVTRYKQIASDATDTRYAFTFSVPLGTGSNAPRAITQLTPVQGRLDPQLGISGSVGTASALHYNASFNPAGQQARRFNANASYHAGGGTLHAGLSQAGDDQAWTWGAAGSAVLHAGGITLGPTLGGDGGVLVMAPGAEGARLRGDERIRVGRRGYAVLPQLSPYRWNQIDLEPSGLPLDVEVLQTSRRVAPTAGSIVRVAFPTLRERLLFIDATDAQGRSLPFAAPVRDEQGRTLGAVGQGGVVQLRSARDAGLLLVDPDGPHPCRMTYRMPRETDRHGLRWQQARCLPLPAAPVPPLSPASSRR